MNGSMQKKIRPVSLISGKQAFLAGLDWKSIPPGYRNARRFARSQGAELYLSCHNHDGENGDEMMIALLSRQDADIPRNIRQCLSLAMLIRPLLKSGGYAIFIIGNDENDDAELTCAFVSVINGILVNDVTGTPTEITEARNTFLMLNAEPENGWVRYEPDGFSPDSRCIPLPLSNLISTRKHPAEARLLPVSRGPQLMTALLIITLLGASWYGWQRYEIWQAEKAEREERARKAAEARITPPWTGQPETGEFIRQCSTTWNQTPLSAAGWRYTLAECSSDGNSGNLRSSYTNTAGTTVTAFIRRITELTDTRPFIVMPEGNSGGVALPVTFRLPDNPVPVDSLPETRDLQERLTTLAQSVQLQIDWQEVNNSFTDENGNIIQPPWKEYDLQIQTLLPANQLAERFSEPSVRFLSVTRQLENGRFRYQFTGKYYAR